MILMNHPLQQELKWAFFLMQHVPYNGFHSCVATSWNNIWVMSIIMGKKKTHSFLQKLWKYKTDCKSVKLFSLIKSYLLASGSGGPWIQHHSSHLLRFSWTHLKDSAVILLQHLHFPNLLFYGVSPVLLVTNHLNHPNKPCWTHEQQQHW